jgi:hypothetical protein
MDMEKQKQLQIATKQKENSRQRIYNMRYYMIRYILVNTLWDGLITSPTDCGVSFCVIEKNETAMARVGTRRHRRKADYTLCNITYTVFLKISTDPHLKTLPERRKKNTVFKFSAKNSIVLLYFVWQQNIILLASVLEDI